MAMTPTIFAASSSRPASPRAWGRTKPCFPGRRPRAAHHTGRPNAALRRHHRAPAFHPRGHSCCRKQFGLYRSNRCRVRRDLSPQSRPRTRPIQLSADRPARNPRPRLRCRDDHARRLSAFELRSLALLSASFERALARGLWAVAPENNGEHGHPLLVNREMIDAFLAAPVTSNAREVLHVQRSGSSTFPFPIRSRGRT